MYIRVRHREPPWGGGHLHVTVGRGGRNRGPVELRLLGAALWAVLLQQEVGGAESPVPIGKADGPPLAAPHLCVSTARLTRDGASLRPLGGVRDRPGDVSSHAAM